MTDQSHTPPPVGYLIEKSGINNGHYFISPAEFAHVEERFRHLYTPVYAGPIPSLVKALEEIARGCDEDGRGAHDGEIVKLVRAERIARAALSAYRGEGK